MIRTCPRCLYRGAVLDDGYGECCINCSWQPVDADALAQVIAEDNPNGGRSDGTRRKPRAAKRRAKVVTG